MLKYNKYGNEILRLIVTGNNTKHQNVSIKYISKNINIYFERVCLHNFFNIFKNIALKKGRSQLCLRKSVVCISYYSPLNSIF